ncbi:hypothetical protein PBN151_6073 [Paenibacillus sp. NAIST15-1]|nr:hypothetical protein PBN151_6073 [Paenibacillus sp. NAIST15-1]
MVLHVETGQVRLHWTPWYVRDDEYSNTSLEEDGTLSPAAISSDADCRNGSRKQYEWGEKMDCCGRISVSTRGIYEACPHYVHIITYQQQGRTHSKLQERPAAYSHCRQLHFLAHYEAA